MASFGEKKFMFLIAGGGLKRVVFGDTSCWVFYLLFFAIGVLQCCNGSIQSYLTSVERPGLVPKTLKRIQFTNIHNGTFSTN